MWAKNPRDFESKTIPCYFPAKTEQVGYIIPDVERLRTPMRQITDYILRVAGVKSKAEVVKLNDKRNIAGLRR